MTVRERISGYERRMESLIVDISKETTQDGLKAYYNFDNLISEFNEIINSVEMVASSNTGGLARLIPGDRKNDG